MVQPGDPFRVSARLQNPGPAETVDVYLGTILPDGASAVMVTRLDPVTTTVARVDGGPAGLPPLAVGLPVTAGLDLPLNDLVALPFTADALPVGRTTLFAVLARSGGPLEVLLSLIHI